jgi:hypothetical protein
MNFSHIMLVVGVVALAAALRSFAHPALRKLGAIAVLAATFLGGYFLSGHIWVGVMCMISWFFLPWLEILTRVRRLRLPMERRLSSKHAPSRDDFPNLEELTQEIEDEGFEHVDDLGWDLEDQRQFLRVFHKPSERIQAAIYLVEQAGLAFYYLRIWSRTRDGNLFITWNYPFSESLRLPPHLRLYRVRGDASVTEMLDGHAFLLLRERVDKAELMESDPDEVRDQLQQDLSLQLAHNLRTGLLKRTGDGLLRYSWRGMFYLWWQFVRDLVRFS